MNWPNRLTIMRVALIPVFVVLMYINTELSRVLALVTFMLASFTDWLDGWMARRQNIVTNFGKFLDPVADKLLVLSCMVMLCSQGIIPAWACILVLFRDLAVDGLRLIAVEQGHVIAAGKLGKLKTSLQMLMLVCYLVAGAFQSEFFTIVGNWLLWIALAMTVASGVDYFVRNRTVLTDMGDKQ